MNRILANKIKLLSHFSLNKYSTCIYNEEFNVIAFCNLIVKCSFNIKIIPLDVHAYPNCNKLILKVFAPSSISKVNINCNQNNNKSVSIIGDSSVNENISCFIETPVKSDLTIKATGTASIDVRKMNGDLISLDTELGNITSFNCQTSKICYNTRGGCITTLGTLHASEIELQTRKTGHINVNHLQALKANIKTETGNLNIKSSYCDETYFQTDLGNLTLDNIHKKCTILITEKGDLQMTGFDGTLDVFIKDGYIDIQASKLYETSIIYVENKSTLLLRLSEWIQQNTVITTTCQQLKIDDNVQLLMKNDENCAVFVPKVSNHKSELVIKALQSNVNIQEASWSDMLKLKGIHFSD